MPVLLTAALLSACESSRVLGRVQESIGIPRRTIEPAPVPGGQVPTGPGGERSGQLPSEERLPSGQGGREFDLSPLVRGEGTPAPAGPESVRALPRANANTNRVALLLPLSGPEAATGLALRNAAQVALFDAADQRFELVFEDTQGTQEGAADAASLALSDGVSLILGPLLAQEVSAIQPQARAAGVNIISFSNDRSVAGNGIFTMGFLPGDQVRRVVAYARSRGLTRFAVLAPDNPYGNLAVEAMKESIERVGGQLTRVKMYDPNIADFTATIRDLADYDRRRNALISQRRELEASNDDLAKSALRRLETLQTIGDLPFQALLVAEGGRRLQEIAALLPFFDIDPGKVRILGTQQWDRRSAEPPLGTEPALVGGWYAAPPAANRAAFEAQYKKLFGEDPPRLATLAYDVTALAALLARGGSDPFGLGSLSTSAGFIGQDGIFRLLPSGVVERGLAVMEVQPRAVRVISPAPEFFGSLTN